MALPFGVLWICNLLFWGYICFPSQKGCNVAHGYYLNDNEFGSHVGVLHPHPSNQLNALSLKPNQDSASLRDEMQAIRNQRFVSRQREPVLHENHQEAGFTNSLSEEMSNGKSESEQDVPSSPLVSKYQHGGSDQHPLGILLREHSQAKNMPGPSFLSIKDFKQFIELMKSAFLMPGNDLESHFQTARETIKKEIASNAQNKKRQHDTGHRSSAREGIAHDDTRGNKDWREAMSTAVEHGANYQMPSERLSVPASIDPTERLIPTSVYDRRGHGPGSAVYPRDHLAATEHVSKNLGGFASGGNSRDSPDSVTSAPHVKNQAVQLISYKAPGQTPYGSLIGHDWSLSGHLTAPSVNSGNRPSQPFSHYSSKTLEKNIGPEPKCTAHSEGSTMENQKPSRGLELAKDVQSRGTSSQILSAPIRTPLNSYGLVYRVMAPRGQIYIPDYQQEHDLRPAISSQDYQPTVGRQSNYINYIQTSHPHDAQILPFKRKKPVRFSTYTVQPSSS